MATRKSFLRLAEGHEDLGLRLSGLVLDDGTGQIVELSADPIDAIHDARRRVPYGECFIS